MATRLEKQRRLAVDHGLYVRPVADGIHVSEWVPCAANDPDAGPDCTAAERIIRGISTPELEKARR